MPALPPLSEEAREEERTERHRLDQIETRLRELRPRRQELVQELLARADDLRHLHAEQSHSHQTLGQLNDEHRAIGRDLSALRRGLGEALQQRDDRLARVRELRAALPQGGRPRIDRIRREVEKLELDQQTRAVPLADENALIAHLRELRKELSQAEAEVGLARQQTDAVRAAEREFETGRAEVERIRGELDHRRAEREQKMQALKTGLVELGRLVATIREAAAARGAIRLKLDALSDEVRNLEKEYDSIRQRHRDRRSDARRLLLDHNRSVRRSTQDPRALDRAVDDRLETLLEEGKIRLGG